MHLFIQTSLSVLCCATLLAVSTQQAIGQAQEKKLPCDELTEKALAKTSPETVQSITAFTPAKVLQRKDPRYPSLAARDGKEGWVKISYVIDTEGKVKDPVVVDNGGSSRFKKAAMSAIKEWQYTPAIKNGKAVEQCHHSIQIDFSLLGQHGASRKFIVMYRKASQAMDEGDLAKAEKIVKRMKEKSGGNRYENAWLWALDASIATETGDLRRELNSIDKALASSKTHEDEYKTFKDDYLASLYRRKFALHLEFNEFSTVLYTSRQIKTLENGDDIIAPLLPYIQKVEDFIASEDNIVVNRTLSESGRDFYYLARSKFGFSDINGKLDAVEVRCDSHREKFTVATDHIWSIPESWGDCQVLIEGKEGTEFKLVEVSKV
ncbi:energy transducer TonB [Agaribacter marinus]|uniref:TonB C-terminal domain-containing protein n=1 Tax=Agaribacter marinus TaxID=1431249 RepID=A0AA37T1V7_9ALTE|nr:energy transducer TonB [Agaribacter marinus]GLR72375.1 hypothetical protein GCM10007852_32830 [Agaribacter marinus]